MGPPLISEYKQSFVIKRFIETLLGGPRLFSPISFIAIQIIIFSIPAVIVSLVNLDRSRFDLQWKSVITGCSIFIVDFSLAIVIILLKGRTNAVQSLSVPSVRISDIDGESENGESGGGRDNGTSQVRHHEHVSSFLSQEDMVPNDKCYKPSTWIFIAPNPTASIFYIMALMASALSFGLCTPLMISEVISPVLRGFIIFGMCNARYSSIINSPPEMAIFDTVSPEKRHILYRIFYTLMIGISYFIFAQFPNNPEEHCVMTWLGAIVASFPLLFGIGVLPDPSALFPWALGTLLIILGGSSPSYHYAGTLVSLIFVGICPIIVFIITQESLKIVLAECICGYIIACDTGRIISMKSTFCEDIPTKSFLRRLLFPSINVLTSLLCVFLSWIHLSSDSKPSEIGYEISLVCTTLTIAISSWAFRYWAMSQSTELTKIILIPIHVLHGFLTFLLHGWLTLSIEHEQIEWSSVKESESHQYSLLRLVPYLLAIRGFALAISEPRKSCVDFSIAFFLRLYLTESKSSFVLILFICSLVSGRIKRFFQKTKTFFSIWYAFGICTIMGSKKIRLVILSVILLPLSLLFLIMASVVEGIALVPIFTLPIFILGFPRPSTFWSERWFPKKGQKKGVVKHFVELETVDWKIYSEIGPLLASSLSKKAHMTKFCLERGDCFLARYEDRLLFIRVVSSGWNFTYLQIKGTSRRTNRYLIASPSANLFQEGINFLSLLTKGLEMQEQTSCHHHEAAKVDEIFDAVLTESRSTFSKLAVDLLSLLILSPMCTLSLPTYSESKSTIYALAIPEEKSTFRDIFYRTFSYLWIKNNPALKGESYQNGINKRTTGTSNRASIPNADSSDNSTPMSTAITKNEQFSVKHALVNFTKPTMEFFKRMDSTDRRNSITTIAASGATATDQQDAWEPSSPEDEEIPVSTRRRSVISRQSSIIMQQTDGSFGGRRYSVSTPVPVRLIDVESDTIRPHLANIQRGTGRDASSTGTDRLSTIWVKQCVGDVIPSNAVKARVEKICNSVWDTVVGVNEENEIELSEFFQDDFLLKLKKLVPSPRVDMEQITLKAFRYACKLALDEIFSTTTNASSKVITISTELEEDLFTQLNAFERDYQFCSPQEIPFWMSQNANHIVTMNKSEEKAVMRMLHYEPQGVEFKVGQLDQFTVEGIWANLNLELLYLTSDDDERFSIQNDRVLLRNMMTQCAKAPLGYPVYDALFRVNLHNFSVTQMT